MTAVVDTSVFPSGSLRNRQKASQRAQVGRKVALLTASNSGSSWALGGRRQRARLAKDIVKVINDLAVSQTVGMTEHNRIDLHQYQ